MNTIYERAVSWLENGTSFALAVIAAHRGTGPRGVGACMLISSTEAVGSVGGGQTEALVLKAARDEILPAGGAILRTYATHCDEETGSPCSGENDILIASVSGGAAEEVFREARDLAASGRRGWFFCLYEPDSDEPFHCCLNTGNGRVVGSYEGRHRFVREMLADPLRAAIHGEGSDGVLCVTCEINAAGRVFLFGGGHVSRETAKLCVSLGYTVTVFDDRKEFCTQERFPGCRTVVLPDFGDLSSIEPDSDSYLLIMTRGHSHDATVLRWALTMPHRYIGMIGSRSKRDALYRSLEKQGFSRSLLESVHCPIGLTIGAETPAEIAVSIAAEMILTAHAVPVPDKPAPAPSIVPDKRRRLRFRTS